MSGPDLEGEVDPELLPGLQLDLAGLHPLRAQAGLHLVGAGGDWSMRYCCRSCR